MANNRSVELASANLLLQQQLQETANSIQLYPSLSTAQSIITMQTVEHVLPLLQSGNQLLGNSQLQLDGANKRLREFEEQTEIERKQRILSEELTLVTNRFRDFKNSLSYSSNVVSYSSSSSGAHTQLDPPEILTTAFSSGTTANINSISTLGYTGLSNQVGGAPPGKAAPSGSATLYDKDGIPYH